ncbi:MAG: 50S ribosomal protein L22 [Patescibacteria group bacterium]|nr:50S ribosomal protein L22 [Patescibacteria group bacterium]
MKVSSKLKYLKVAPRKTRLVADLIRGKKVEDASVILNFTIKKSAQPILKLLNSAIANADNNFSLNPENLYIYKITVDEGPKYKRWMPRARGRVTEIQKKSSHITLVLEEITPVEKDEKSKKVKKTDKAKEAKKPLVVEEKSKTWEEVKKEKNLGESAGEKKTQSNRDVQKPKEQKSIKRIFRRKSF